MDETYNGWTNRETWNTHLWMTNDPADYEMARTIVRERYESDMDYPEVGAADALKDWWDELYEPQGMAASPLVDAWSYAIDRTDWRAIVEAFTEGETWAADREARITLSNTYHS